MSTVGDLCAQILLESGVVGQGQTPTATDANNCLKRINQQIAQWNRERWLVYHLIDVTCVSTGNVSYTVGPGGDFDAVRPDRLEFGCFFRLVNSNSVLLDQFGQPLLDQYGNEMLDSSFDQLQSSTVDYPLDIIQSHEDYNRITLKAMGTWPSQVFYDSDYPTGRALIWPVPPADMYVLHLLMKQQLTQFTGLSQVINLPPEYEAAINYNGQVRTRVAYRMQPDPMMIGLARGALSVIRGANIQMPTLRMPAIVINNARRYNVYSDDN